MDRRGYATGAGLLAGLVLAGCLRPDGGSGSAPTIEGADATVAAGDRATVTVRAEEVDQLSFGVPFLDAEDLSVEGFDVEPTPDATAESFPPVWLWESAQARVTASMTVRAAADATPRTVSYRVAAALGERSVSESFALGVESA
jgi:hypothetical protein